MILMLEEHYEHHLQNDLSVKDLISTVTWSPSCRSPFCSADPHCTVYGRPTPGTDPDSLAGASSCPPQDPQTTPWGMWR